MEKDKAPKWRRMKAQVEKDEGQEAETPQSSLEKAMVNALDCLTSEEEKDLKACLEDLDRQDSIPEGEAKFETLEEKVPSEKKKVSDCKGEEWK